MRLSRLVDRGAVVSLGPSHVALARQEPALDAENLSVTVALVPARSLDLRDAFVDQFERALDIALLCEPLGENQLEIGNHDAPAARVPERESRLDQRDPVSLPALPNSRAATRPRRG